MLPAFICSPQITPAARPNSAAVASEFSPSPSMRVRPPWLTSNVPPPAGLPWTCQKSYSQPSGWITAMCASPPPAGRAALGMRTRCPSISQELVQRRQ